MSLERLAKLWEQFHPRQTTVRFRKTTIRYEGATRHVTIEERDHLPESEKGWMRHLLADGQEMLEGFRSWLE